MPSASISARRTAGSHVCGPIGRNSDSPTMIIAARSESIRNHGQPSPPHATERSGQPFGTR